MCVEVQCVVAVLFYFIWCYFCFVVAWVSKHPWEFPLANAANKYAACVENKIVEHVVIMFKVLRYRVPTTPPLDHTIIFDCPWSKYVRTNIIFKNNPNRCAFTKLWLFIFAKHFEKKKMKFTNIFIIDKNEINARKKKEIVKKEKKEQQSTAEYLSTNNQWFLCVRARISNPWTWANVAAVFLFSSSPFFSHQKKNRTSCSVVQQMSNDAYEIFLIKNKI